MQDVYISHCSRHMPFRKAAPALRTLTNAINVGTGVKMGDDFLFFAAKS